jgi:kynurenine formamidase
MGPADVIDVTEMCGLGEKGTSPPITERDIEAWEAVNGAILPGDVVFFHTGWDRYYKPGAAGVRYCRIPFAGLGTWMAGP